MLNRYVVGPLCVLALFACARGEKAPASKLTVTSAAFRDGDSIPAQFTCDGPNQSPPLAWSGAPAKTASYAVIVHDPDAPNGGFTHWVAFDIPATVTSLPASVPKGDAPSQLGGGRQGQNSFGGTAGYGGPCPPKGAPHHYHFRVSALDTRLGLAPGVPPATVDGAVQQHEVARGELVATYARK